MTSMFCFFSVSHRREKFAKEIVSRTNPGEIILLHDGYGTLHDTAKADKSLTVKALPLIIEQLQAKGYRFVTVPELLNVPAYNEALPVNLGNAVAQILAITTTLDPRMAATPVFHMRYRRIRHIHSVCTGERMVARGLPAWRRCVITPSPGRSVAGGSVREAGGFHGVISCGQIRQHTIAQVLQ